MSDIEINHFKRGLAGILAILIVLVITLGCARVRLLGEPAYPKEKNETEVKVETNFEIENELEGGRTLAVKVEDDASANKIVVMTKTQDPEPSVEAAMLARLVRGEAGGIWSLTEQACVMWVVLNRVDTGKWGDTIAEVITSPYQFYYIPSFGTTDDYGRDLIWLAEDVISRWEREKAGETDVGRVLPVEYLYFGGDGYHNYFRTTYEFGNGRWYYELPSPYEN